MRSVVLPLLLTACAYEAPLDPEATGAAAQVTGTVIVTGLDEAADTLVLVYPGDNPPPPAGTGSPLTFGVVPAAAFRSATAGSLEATFDLTLQGVADGEVLITALVDVDGDFYPLSPFSTVTGGATCGDLSGAHLRDLETGELAPVTVAANQTASGVTVLVGRESTFERPAFVMQGGSPVLVKEDYLAGETLLIDLASTEIGVARPDGDGLASFLELTGPFDGSDTCDTAFWVTVVDADGDGLPDPHPVLGDAAMDAYPQLILQFLGTVDAEGTLTPTDPAVDGSWVAYAALFPDDVWFGTVPLNTPTPLTEVSYAWAPVAQHTLPDGTVEIVAPDPEDPTAAVRAIPVGAWSVTVVNVAGQTWTLPNELGRLPPLQGFDSYEPQSQRGALILE